MVDYWTQDVNMGLIFLCDEALENVTTADQRSVLNTTIWLQFYAG